MSRLSSLPLLAALLAGVAACDREAPTASPPEASLDSPIDFGLIGLGRPLGMLNFDQRHLFARGRVVFNAFFSPDSGLGPLFNGRSCAECHEDPVPGGVGDEVETHASSFVGGVCSDLASVGGPVVQDSVTPLLHTALGIDSEPMLPGATNVGHRTSVQVMGLGLVDGGHDA